MGDGVHHGVTATLKASQENSVIVGFFFLYGAKYMIEVIDQKPRRSSAKRFSGVFAHFYTDTLPL